MAEDIQSPEYLTIRLLQRPELPRILLLIRELNPAIPETVLAQRLEEMAHAMPADTPARSWSLMLMS